MVVCVCVLSVASTHTCTCVNKYEIQCTNCTGHTEVPTLQALRQLAGDVRLLREVEQPKVLCLPRQAVSGGRETAPCTCIAGGRERKGERGEREEERERGKEGERERRSKKEEIEERGGETGAIVTEITHSPEVLPLH